MEGQARDGDLKAEDKILNGLIGDLNESDKFTMESWAVSAHGLNSSRSNSNDLHAAYMESIRGVVSYRKCRLTASITRQTGGSLFLSWNGSNSGNCLVDTLH